MKQLTLSTGVVCLMLSAFSSFSQPSLSQEQMQEDFDFLTNHLSEFAVHMDINSIRYDLVYKQEFDKLRDKIDNKISICDFRDLLVKATNLVQDGHCNFMGYDYLSTYGQYQDKFNFKDDQTYEHIKSIEDYCSQDEKATLPVLPVTYISGNYYIFTDIVINNDTVKSGTKISKIDSMNIDSYLKNRLKNISPLRWDEEKNKPYQEYFYLVSEKAANLTLENNGVKSELKLSYGDSIKYLSDIQNNIEYYSQNKSQAFFLSEINTLYVGLSFMTMDNANLINQQIDSIMLGETAENVIIDIRGNPGGNDQAWRAVLKNLISKPITMESDLKFRYGKEVVKHYKSKKNPTPMALLNDAPYWDYSYSNKKLRPSKKGHKIEGEIYILQDEYIFSSAGNLAMLALNSDQLVSVGISNGLIGGAQTNPLFFKLPHSGLIFRLEPMLDFSHVEKLSDFNHNQVEWPLTVDYRYYEKRYTSERNLYSKDFLLQEDDMFSQLIELIISKNDIH